MPVVTFSHDIYLLFLGLAMAASTGRAKPMDRMCPYRNFPKGNIADIPKSKVQWPKFPTNAKIKVSGQKGVKTVTSWLITIKKNIISVFHLQKTRISYKNHPLRGRISMRLGPGKRMEQGCIKISWQRSDYRVRDE